MVWAGYFKRHNGVVGEKGFYVFWSKKPKPDISSVPPDVEPLALSSCCCFFSSPSALFLSLLVLASSHSSPSLRFRASPLAPPLLDFRSSSRNLRTLFSFSPNLSLDISIRVLSSIGEAVQSSFPREWYPISDS